MVSFRGQKKVWATPRSVSFTSLIPNFQRASPLLSYAESPPPPGVKHGVGAGADYSAPGRGLSFFKNAVLGLGSQLQP